MQIRINLENKCQNKQTAPQIEQGRGNYVTRQYSDKTSLQCRGITKNHFSAKGGTKPNTTIIMTLQLDHPEPRTVIQM